MNRDRNRMGTVWISALAAGALALMACGSPEQGGGAPGAEAKPGTETAAAPAPKPAPVAPKPAPAKPAASADNGSRTYACIDGDAKAGQAQYVVYCATCHGAAGAGDGIAAAGLNPKPAKHTDGAYMNVLSNQHLHKVIKEGGAAVGKSPLMTPWGGVLNDAQIWDMVAFVRSVAVPAYACP